MGNQSSAPEKVYAAVKANNYTNLVDACQRMRGLDEAARRKLLEYADAEGRTPLLLAVTKGSEPMVKLLLAQGANVNAVTGKANGGSALHIAVSKRHTLLVDILLAHGGNPFVDNLSGRCAMDLALAGGHVNILRKLEGKALFAGEVCVKVPKYQGFTQAWKDRWCVIMPRLSWKPQPGGGRGALGNVLVLRTMLWIYKDKYAREPRTKIWLDGATAVSMGTHSVEGYLRLHPTHNEPSRVCTKFDRGWLVFVKPAEGLTDTSRALADFNKFIQICGAPSEYSALVSSGGSSSNAASPWQAATMQPQQQPQQQQQQGMMPQSSMPLPQQQQRPPYTAPWPAVQQQPPVPLPQQQYQSSYAWPDGGAAAPSSAAPLGMHQRNATMPSLGGADAASLTAYPPVQYNDGMCAVQRAQLPPAAAASGGAEDDTHWQAAPGESDEDFARRLARMASAASSGGSECASPPSRAHSYSQSQHVVHEARASRPSGGSSSGGVPPPALSLALEEEEEEEEPSAPPLSNRPSATATAAAAMRDAAAIGMERNSSGSVADGSTAGGEEELCVICLSNPREVGLLHGATVHRCACKECAKLVKVNSACPMCRQPVERIIGVY